MSPELLDAVETRLREESVLAGGSGGTGEGVEEQERTSSRPARPASATETPSVERIQDVQEQMQLLLEQAQYTENTEAEFVANKGIELLDELAARTE